MKGKKVKVLHVIKSLGRGGAERLLIETMRLHNKSVFEFHCVYFLPWKNHLVSELEAEGCNVCCLSASNNLRLLLRVISLSNYIKRNEIDVIHAHLPWSGVVARLAGKVAGVPVIYSEHNKQERYHMLTRIVNLATLGLATQIVGVSGDVTESIVKHKHSVANRTRTILNGVNVDHFNRSGFDPSEVKIALGIPKGTRVVGTVAVFRSQKALDVWIHTASKIARDVKNVYFLIVGDGPLKNQLIQLIEDAGLSALVHMPGLQVEVRPFLAAMDVYMMSSRFEGLPIALLEAMAMECAVVTTNAGGIGEVIRDGVDGLLVTVDDGEALYLSAVRLLDDEQLRHNFAKAARERIIERFAMNYMVRELESTYESVKKSAISPVG